MDAAGLRHTVDALVLDADGEVVVAGAVEVTGSQGGTEVIGVFGLPGDPEVSPESTPGGVRCRDPSATRRTHRRLPPAPPAP